jgi:hypothetical protein
MKSYNKRYISRADFHALQSLRIPYTGFVKGAGYAYTSFGFIPPAHQHRISAPTDPNGTASSDATPFRAHKTYILSDALSWISLIGSMSRPRTNSRSTNFWAWFSQGLEKLGDMGSAMAPREAYSNESQAPTYNRPDSIATPWIKPNGDINYFKGKVGEYPNIRSQITEKEFDELPKNKSTKFNNLRIW